MEVRTDTSSGQNRPMGVGNVTEAKGVGAATVMVVQYLKAYDGGRTHREIGVADMTVLPAIAVPGFCPDEQPKVKRQKRKPTVYKPEGPVQVKAAAPLNDEARLVEDLRKGWGKPKGWRRRAMREILGNHPALKSNRQQMTLAEIRQLEKEVALLQRYIADPNPNLRMAGSNSGAIHRGSIS